MATVPLYFSISGTMLLPPSRHPPFPAAPVGTSFTVNVDPERYPSLYADIVTFWPRYTFVSGQLRKDGAPVAEDVSDAGQAAYDSANLAASQQAQRDAIGAVANTDPRLSDARTPTAHNHSADAWFTTALAGKLGTGATAADVNPAGTNIAAALAGKAAASHTHTWGEVTGKPTTLAGYGITDAVPETAPLVVVPTTGQTQTFTTTKAKQIIVCNHTSTIAAQTFVFPSDANSQLNQELAIFSRSIITTVTLTTTGLTMLGAAVTTLAANSNVRWKKVAALTWARVQ